MPPKQPADPPKQKNLTAFFTKASAQAKKSTPFKTPNAKAEKQNERRDKNAFYSQASSSPVIPKTPGSDFSDIRVDSNSFAVPPSSVLSSSRTASSPPTSDGIIDVEMLASDDEDEAVIVKTVNIFSACIHETLTRI